ncbi:MAG TPA: hypothetical protein VKG01_20750 [Thermoanaerobaculia bacterium]|nr:hypothetical protein [Thermoanaerobaculia bacterium]
MRRLAVAAAAALLAGSAFGASPQATPSPVPTPAPATPGESPGQALIEQEESAMSGRSYSYDPAGRRDPFRSLLIRSDKGGGHRAPGIAGIAIDDVTLQGIWRTRAGYVAQIRGTDNKSYLLRSGDQLYDGEVLRIAPNEVTFRQNLNDPQSVKPFRDITKQLNATIKP